jgi:hypothetical protein
MLAWLASMQADPTLLARALTDTPSRKALP